MGTSTSGDDVVLFAGGTGAANEGLRVFSNGDVNVTKTLWVGGNNISAKLNAAYGQANSAYDAANNAKVTVYANSDSGVTTQAINFVNSAAILVAVANSAGNANVTLSLAGTPYEQANSARDQANTARDQANTARGTANDAYGQANTARNTANAAYAQANSDYQPAVTELAVTNNGATAYRFDQYGATTDDPTIYVRAGETIAFNLNNAGHPFAIRVSDGGANTTDGLTHVATDGTVSTGADAQGKVSGKLYWKVPYVLGGNTYVYQCTAHAGMVGNIVIETDSTVIYAQANNARDQANTARSTANTGYGQANTARNQANTAYGQANAAYSQANAAYTAANNAQVTVYANSASDVTTQKINFVNTSTITVAVTNSGGNANIAFTAVGGAAYDQANAAYGQANSARDQANTARTQANTARDTANAAYGQANTATTNAGNAYDTANTKVSKSGDTMTGDLTILRSGITTLNIESATSGQYHGGYLNLRVANAAGQFGETSLQHAMVTGNTDTTDTMFQIQQRTNTGSFVVSIYEVSYKGNTHIWRTPHAGAEALRIDVNANVGIGGIVPTSKLHVSGNANITSTITTAANINAGNVYTTGNVSGTLKSTKDFILANTNVNAANTIDLSVSNYFRCVMTASAQFTFTNAPASGTGQLFSLLLIQDGSGGRTPTWANTIYWAGGSAPPATTNANARDLWTFITYDGGTTYWGSLTIKDAR
jgi:hypothetical protein